MESLTSGTHWSVEPTGQRDKTEHDSAARLELVDGESAGGDIITQ